jgi:Tfp pilus assembly protein PilF
MGRGSESKMNKVVSLFAVVSIMIGILLSGCAGQSQPDESRVKISSQQDAGRAVTSLLAKADTQVQQKQWERAAAYLERALRIEPRNGYLWHRLARVRMQQGQIELAKNLVQKSNALAGMDEDLKLNNAQLLEQLRLLTQEAPL